MFWKTVPLCGDFDTYLYICSTGRKTPKGKRYSFHINTANQLALSKVSGVPTSEVMRYFPEESKLLQITTCPRGLRTKLRLRHLQGLDSL
jgi:hypothetical protein